jgi:hypothetical protein
MLMCVPRVFVSCNGFQMPEQERSDKPSKALGDRPEQAATHLFHDD